MPWRHTDDPYRILLSEYLLQRTRVASGTPYYERFVKRFPDIRSLAAATEEDVLRAWEGLGFYRRARNLHHAAKTIMDRHGGAVPSNTETLRQLPGIGAYTAGAVASIAFGERVPAVDGNVTRVLARLYRVEEDVSRRTGRDRIKTLAESLVPSSRPGAFNQALMELGATVCTPRSPACPECPLEDVCASRKAGMQESLPMVSRLRKPRTVPVAFAHVASRGRVLLVRRPESGLLAGLWSLPGGEIARDAEVSKSLGKLVLEQTGLRIDVGETAARVAHTFSHRQWSGAIYRCEVRATGPLAAPARWIPKNALRELPLIPFHRKALDALQSRHAREVIGARRE
jgi:A/G-specific adenine glycosylase